MEYIYAALLLHHAGKKIDEASVKSVLTAAGVAADDSRVKALVAALEGVNIAEAIAKAAVAPVAAAPAAHAAAPAAAAAAAPAAEEKKEEKKAEEESAMAGLGALFG
jgi:large subunit ribosomal protein L12